MIRSFAPPPGSMTGVADYAVALDRALEGSSLAAPIYHVGNNALHREIYERALAEPGYVILHDATLHHFLLGTLTAAAYEEEFVYNYGEWHRGLARDLYAQRGASAADDRYFHYGLLRRIAERSRAVIVHNAEAARRVREASAAARVVEIPHLLAIPDPLPARVEIEGAAGPVFAVFGHLRESKRLVTILKAFAVLRGERAATLMIQGAFVSAEYERAVADLLAQPGVVRREHLDERAWWGAAQACDVCLNLRYPSAGEASGIAVRLMGLGKPVVVTAGAEWSAYPGGTCWPVTGGGSGELEHLVETMRWFAEHPALGREMGRAAREFVRTAHSPERVAAQLVAAFS